MVRTVREISSVSDREWRSGKAVERRWPFCKDQKGEGEPDKNKLGRCACGHWRWGIFSAWGAVSGKGWEEESSMCWGSGVWCGCHERSWRELVWGECEDAGSMWGIWTLNVVEKSLWEASAEKCHDFIFKCLVSHNCISCPWAVRYLVSLC